MDGIHRALDTVKDRMNWKTNEETLPRAAQTLNGSDTG